MDTLAATDDSVAVVENSSISETCINATAEHYHEGNRRKILQFIEEITTNVDEVQTQVLSEILSGNAQVEYLQRHGLNGHTDRETFKKVIPVVCYEDLIPDIDPLIANGNSITSSILGSRLIKQFIRSTGTSSGVRKLIPLTQEQEDKIWHFQDLVMPVISQHVPGLDKGKAMHLLFVAPDSTTPGGLIANSIVPFMHKSLHFKNLFRNVDPYRNFTSPIEIILCEDTYQSMYCQLLCGLYQNSHVLRLGFIFSSVVVQAVKFLQEHWILLCDDIRNGNIAVGNTKITDQTVKKAVMNILVKPNPELADFIERECKRDESWKGILSRLWPNAKYIDAIITGTMSHHIPIINFYTNELPIVSQAYGCSESVLGLNLNPLCKPNEVSYTFIPTMAYCEFLPIVNEDVQQNNNCNLEEEQRHQELVDLADVKLGGEYEVVITNYAGLYRYRVGDVLQVSGFKNNAPQFSFVCRKNAVLSIDHDKTTEVELQNAVRNAFDQLMSKLNVSLVEYTSFADASTNPGHYVIYWELQCSNNNASISVPVFEKCCLIIEESLGAEYRSLRVNNKHIGPLELKIVETGTFDKLMNYAINQGTSVSQYKTPRGVKLGPILELLNSQVISNYFSPKCPNP
ncbi:hypothetical protein C5167_012086 [Papaver somniferum]|uniref:Uncharacterized protein n=1 Tax=Papaver somniferum TaxID=3469 RepID=A0A4Y7J0Q5_PAPSO|nr:indole-3-acetic acid-amido synthetase GH3.6-like [Papaver somniferum]RZC53235.1 hypothetical protein C5167_012086 [Papaver somniferum]